MCTGKRAFEDASAYTNFVLKNVGEMALFKYCSLQPVDYWRELLFKDAMNHAGIKESNPENIAAQWDVASHLPPVLEEALNAHIGEIILRVDRFLQTGSGEERRLDEEEEARTLLAEMREDGAN